MPFTAGQRHVSKQRNVSTQMLRAASLPSVSATEVKFILNSSTGKTCRLEKLNNNQDASFSVLADKSCDNIFEGLSQAEAWVDGLHGNANIISNKGKVILSIGPSDGFAYESTDSSPAIITFSEG